MARLVAALLVLSACGPGEDVVTTESPVHITLDKIDTHRILGNIVTKYDNPISSMSCHDNNLYFSVSDTVATIYKLEGQDVNPVFSLVNEYQVGYIDVVHSINVSDEVVTMVNINTSKVVVANISDGSVNNSDSIVQYRSLGNFSLTDIGTHNDGYIYRVPGHKRVISFVDRKFNTNNRVMAGSVAKGMSSVSATILDRMSIEHSNGMTVMAYRYVDSIVLLDGQERYFTLNGVGQPKAREIMMQGQMIVDVGQLITIYEDVDIIDNHIVVLSSSKYGDILVKIDPVSKTYYEYIIDSGTYDIKVCNDGIYTASINNKLNNIMYYRF